MSIIAAIGLLSGCAASPDLIANKLHVALPPDSMYDCSVTPLPNNFVNHNDVAEFMVRSHGNNVKCKNSLNSVKSFLDNEKKVIEAK